MLPARTGSPQHREQDQRDHHGAAEVRLLQNQESDRADDQKYRERSVLELADSGLPLTQELREEKHQRKFHQLRRLRNHGSQPEPSPRSTLHQPETGHVEQSEHYD